MLILIFDQLLTQLVLLKDILYDRTNNDLIGYGVIVIDKYIVLVLYRKHAEIV